MSQTRRKIGRILVSTVPMLMIVLLSPLAWGLIFAFVTDIRWKTALATIWIYGGVWLGGYYHAKVLTEEMEKHEK